MINTLVFTIYLQLVILCNPHPILYISPYGADINNSNCSLQSPCITLQHALNHICVNSLNVTKAEFFINGIASEIFKQIYIQCNSSETLIFTFNVSLSYFPFELWITRSGLTIIVNDMTFDGATFNDGFTDIVKAYSDTNSTIVFNHCIFNNTIIYDALALVAAPSSNVEIHNSYFGYISWTTGYKWWEFVECVTLTIINSYFESLDVYPPADEFYTSYFISTQHLLINGAVFSDIYFHPMPLDWWETEAAPNPTLLWLPENSISITNTSFLNIELDYPLFPLMSSDLPMFIEQSSFHGISNTIVFLQGAVVHMNDINIIVSRYQDEGHYLFETDIHSQLYITNLAVTFSVNNQLQSICSPYSLPSYLRVLNEEPFRQICCNRPAKLANNNGYLSMLNVNIQDDLTQVTANEWREHMLSKHPDDSSAVFGFTWNWQSWDNPPHLILNKGEMNMVDFTVNGSMIHNGLIFNQGTCIMFKAHVVQPSWIYDDSNHVNLRLFTHIDFTYDAWYSIIDAQLDGSFITNEGLNANLDEVSDCVSRASGVLSIHDSVFMGGAIVDDSYGDIEIINTSISNSVHAFIAHNSISFSISESTIADIGPYYLRDSVVLYLWMRYSVNEGEYLHSTYMENCARIVITNNKFTYFGGNGYIYIQQTHNNVIYASVSNNYFIDDVRLDNLNLNAQIDTIDMVKEVWNNDEHLVHFIGDIESSFYDNVFTQSHIMTSILDKSCLYIEENKYQNCVSGNVFYGIAMTISNAKITSCSHLNLSAQIDTNCWTHGIQYIERIENELIATDINKSLIEVYPDSEVVLIHPVIYAHFSDFNISNDSDEVYYPISIGKNAIISVLDMGIIDEEDQITISFPRACMSNCIELYRNSLNYIHQLHINCKVNESLFDPSELVSIEELESLVSVNRTLPYRIFIDSSQVISRWIFGYFC